MKQRYGLCSEAIGAKTSAACRARSLLSSAWWETRATPLPWEIHKWSRLTTLSLGINWLSCQDTQPTHTHNELSDTHCFLCKRGRSLNPDQVLTSLLCYSCRTEKRQKDDVEPLKDWYNMSHTTPHQSQARRPTETLIPWEHFLVT